MTTRAQAGSSSLSTDLRFDTWPPLSKTLARARVPEAAAMVEPHTVDELRDLVRHFSAMGLRMVAVGGRSNVVGALASTQPAAFISLRRLDRVVAIDRPNCLVTCEAGVLGGVLESRLQREGLTLGHYPQSLHQSTVGGWIATRAMGTFSGRYGGIESLLLGLDVVLADGSLVQVPSSPRFAAGPPLTQLFVGAEGVLGIVVAASLRVSRVPRSRRVEGWALPSLGPTLDVLRELIQSGLQPAVLRLYDAEDGTSLIEQAGGPAGWLPLLVGFDGHPELVEQELGEVARVLGDAGGKALHGLGASWLEHRFDPPAFLSAGEQPGRLGEAIDVSVWWSLLEATYHAIREAVLGAGATTCRAHFSHFYPQGASIYFVIDIQAPDDVVALTRYGAIWEAAMTTCQQLGITPAHHHGFGAVRSAWLRPYLGSAALLLDRLREALDPHHLLNPDRLGGSSRDVPSPDAQADGGPS